MFSAEELLDVTRRAEFTADMSGIRQALVNARMRQPAILFGGSDARLSHFAEAVLSSAPNWPKEDRTNLCRLAAEISEVLCKKVEQPEQRRIMRVRTALLYELSGLPALASTSLEEGDLSPFLMSFFRRGGVFGRLNGFDHSAIKIDPSTLSFGELALWDDAKEFSQVIQNFEESRSAALSDRSISSGFWRFASVFEVGLTATEIRGFSALLTERIRRSTVSNVPFALIPSLRRMEFPAELLPAQKAAIDGGLLQADLPSWGFAAPTGSGKTFLARLLITDILNDAPTAKIIYLVPSKALVNEVASSLRIALEGLGHVVEAISAQLVDLDEEEAEVVDEASVVVMTPEKADMLLRLNADFLQQVRLVVVDEAHHLESGTRGALLELYLWRLKRLLPSSCRYVFLSAVAPNIDQIAKWLDPAGGAVAFTDRPTRMRVGVYKLVGSGISTKGIIQYSDGSTIEVTPQRAERTVRKGICELANHLVTAGPVLIVAKGKKECESIGRELKAWLAARVRLPSLSPEELSSDTYLVLDAALEREMYPEVPLRDLIKHKIGYHHAGLPPKVRQAVEEGIRKRLIDYVIATTTLAEGVNFPFSSVIVESLALRDAPEAGRPSRYTPVSPRSFWNIAGRAGRPGFDSEGQVILFEPSLGLDKINAVIDQYVNPAMTSLAPVGSALASAVQTIQEEVDGSHYVMDDLEGGRLPESMSRRARGAVNLIRVGLMHAYATRITTSPEEILESSFAFRFLTDKTKIFAAQLFESQDKAIHRYVGLQDAPSMQQLAELGLSLDTLTDLREYVQQMQDWQLQNLAKLFYGGAVNLDQAQYVVGPVAKRMSELEGPSLGGFLSDVIVRWLSGVTFTSIRAQARFSDRLEDLISVIYSRVQFLLPWGLWATDWLINQECTRRSINYDGTVKKLAYLADAGVPNFDALGLFHLGLERVDSTRLSLAYVRAGGMNTGVDCLGWVLSRPREQLEATIRGQDNRRVEHKFGDKLAAMQSLKFSR